MSTALQPKPEVIEDALIRGDLKDLTHEQRLSFYKQVCESLGLNPLTKPLEFIYLNGKLTLYARKDATDQLRKIHGVSVDSIQPQLQNEAGLYIVTANGHDKHGRHDSATGVVSLLDARSGERMKGEALANQLMKAETKAKRRLTLSICGLGMLDETEVQTIPGALPMNACAKCGEDTSPDNPLCVKCRKPVAVPELTSGAEAKPESAGENSVSAGGQPSQVTAPSLSPIDVVGKSGEKIEAVDVSGKAIEEKAGKAGITYWLLEGDILIAAQGENAKRLKGCVGRLIECTALDRGVKKGKQTYEVVDVIHIGQLFPSQTAESNLEIQEQDMVPVLQESLKQVGEKKQMPSAPKDDLPF